MSTIIPQNKIRRKTSAKIFTMTSICHIGLQDLEPQELSSYTDLKVFFRWQNYSTSIYSFEVKMP